MTTEPRKNLAGLFGPKLGADGLSELWATAEAAPELAPLPAGEYVCRAEKGELFQSRSGTPGYKITFRVLDGEHAGRRLWADLWLTAAAMPFAKRDLAKLGITSPAQLEKPLPPGIRCSVKVAVRMNDRGEVFNRVSAFEVLGIDLPTADPFAPADATPSPDKREGAGPDDPPF